MSTITDIFKFIVASKTVEGTIQSITTAESIIAFQHARLIPTPYGITLNDIEKFKVFINGQYLNRTAITSMSQSGVDFIIKINHGLAEFAIATDDELSAVGKFEII